MVLTLFFGSGAAALVYEVVWSKYLALMFGSTVQAQTVVLAVFMGGLALGNRLFGALADRAKRPLAAYGWLEIGIGVYAMAFRWLWSRADEVFVRAGSGLLEHGGWLLALKGALAVALLLGPTVLMGGTLPLVAAWLQRSTTDAGRRSARFYSVNSLGAVCGAWFAGFYIVRELGMPVALEMTALANVLIGFAAIVLAKVCSRQREQADRFELRTPNSEIQSGFHLPQAGARQTADHGQAASSASADAKPDSPGHSQRPDPNRAPLRTACLTVALTGAVSMGLEVLASRCLTLIVGASLQAFAMVLMAFILGIGLGSSVVASPRFRHLRPQAATVVLLLCAAAWIGLFVSGIQQCVFAYRVVKSGLAQTGTGFVFHQWFVSLISLLVLGLPAALLGAVLPLWMRAVSRAGESLAGQVGRLLTWNTVGAVGGVLFTGFLMMPGLGLRGAFVAMALALCTAAWAMAFRAQSRRLLFSAGGVAGAVALLAALTGGDWRHVLSSGVFRVREKEADPRAMAFRKEHYRLLFYEDAADATVTVEQGDGQAVSDQLSLRINGKVDASSHGDLATQYLLGHLPILARPESKDVFVLGLGSGVTAGALLAHPVERIVIAENCAPVLRAAKLFEPWNRGVLTNALTSVHREDARTVLKLSPRLYDVIISEPSNPWMAGVGSVFSREFYELCASRLKPGGIMTQWFHVYEMNDRIVEMVLRTFREVFPCVEIWDPGVGDIILLGSRQPWKGGLENFRKVWSRPVATADFEAIGLRTPEALWARLLASQRTAFAIPDNGPVQSDEWPALEYDAPRAFFIGESATALGEFDERTWQKGLADAARRTALQSLDDDTLAEAFGEFTSVNADVTRYLNARVRGAGEGASELFAGLRLIPSIFRRVETNSASSGRINVHLPEGASENLKRLLTAERLIDARPDVWRESVATILEILRQYGPANLNEKVRWSPGQFGAVAIRACLQHGDLALAREALDVVTELGRTREVRFLSRIVDREEEAAGERTARSRL